MKMSKRLIAAVMATTLASCSVPLLGAQAAHSTTSTSPRIYLDLTKDGNYYRADIMMEYVPYFNNAMLGFSLGDSWEIVTDNNGNMVTPTNTHPYTLDYLYVSESNSIVVHSSGVTGDRNHNGVFASFYLKKSANYDVNDSGINPVAQSGTVWSTICKANSDVIYDTVIATSPTMLEADEFMYGDVNGDGRISGSDASCVLNAIGNNGFLVVTDLYNNYLPLIPDMKAAFAADVDRDGYIDESDATKILRTYTLLLSGKDFDEIEGIVGDIDVYEVFDYVD